MKYYVIVAGGGETSRANIEALMEDHYYAKGAEGALVLPVINTATQAQIFAAQYAKEKNKEIIIFSNIPADFPGMPPATVYQTDDPIGDSCKNFAGEDTAAFLLWSDEDALSQSLLSAYAGAGVPCFDLTDGLTRISAVAELKPAEEPEFPQMELDLPKDEPEEADDEEEEEDDEEEYEESEEDDEVYFAVQSLIKAIAKAVATELRKGPQE